MTPATRWPQLKLFFNEGDLHELVSTEFQANQDSTILKTTRRNGHANSISWSRGVQALAIFLVQYVGWSKKHRPEDFEMRGERKSPAATLDMGLGKGKGKDQINLKWQESMFGQREESTDSYLSTYVERTNADQKRTVDPFGLKVRVTRFPPACIRVFLGKRELKDFREFEDLSDKLCKKWKGVQNLPLCPADEPEENAIIAKPNVATDSEQAEPPAPPASKSDLSGQVGLPAREDRSLADWFSQLSSTQIIAYIKTIHFAPDDRIPLIFDELRDPQCLNVMAEKFVGGPVQTMGQLYFEYRDELPELLGGICAAIAANPALCNEHYTKVAQAQFAHLNLWCWFIVKFFGEIAIAQIANVERCFVRFASTPDFKSKHRADDLETICYAVEGFTKLKCKHAIKLLTDWCFEEGARLIKQAKSNKIAEFAAMIGKDNFRVRLEKSMSVGGAAEIIKCLKQSPDLKLHKHG